MTNKEIAYAFQELGQLMELHEENTFKIRSYQNAYLTLRKLDQPVAEMDEAELNTIKGIGKAISGKIRELVTTGKMEILERYRSITPPGVVEMLEIPGFGAKKIRAIWQGLGVESVGELLYAVNENRLIELKGFGAKTQEDLKQKLEFFQRTKDQFLYATLELESQEWLERLRAMLPGVTVELTGEIRRRATTLTSIELLIADLAARDAVMNAQLLKDLKEENGQLRGLTEEGYPICLYFCDPVDFGSKQFRHTASPDFMTALLKAYPGRDFRHLAQEQDVFDQLQLPFIAPELRETADNVERAAAGQLPARLLEETDIRGVVHCHTTASDGIHSLREMAEYARAAGYGYIGITDHSRAAFYANGLSVERVQAQWADIDKLNAELAPFRIFKGIESDILNDGSLDYEDDILRGFDFIIASVHSNLRMDEEKATQRLLRAIENPYTSILGHPTGRLLLSRAGYPIDHRKVIDACAANGVHIELNANPWRLDLDWTWLPYARERGVLISINPDAHSFHGIHDIHYGTLAARKGGLTAEGCLNSREAGEFLRLVKRG